MIESFQTACNLNGEGVAGSVFVPVSHLFTYPLNIAQLSRRRYSLTAPGIKSR